MNIIEICLSPAKGGLELYAKRSAVELSKTDNVISVISKGSELEKLLVGENIKSLSIKVRFRPFPIFSALKLSRVFDKYSIDVLHAHWVKDLPLIALAKKLSKKKPKVIFTRQMQITRSKKDFYHRFVYKEVDRFIAITSRVAQDLKKYLPAFCAQNIDVLYYGVPAPQRYLISEEISKIRKEIGVGDKTFVAGLFGRIKKEKGQYLLINAITKLINENFDVAALIVGHPMESEYLERMKSEVDSCGFTSKIIFKDFVSEPQSLMQICDVVVLASYEETFGLVLAEAMRAGVPVIGSNSGGVPEIINHKIDGLLFTPKDSSDLYECLKLLINDNALKESIGKVGKEKADRLFEETEHFIKLRALLLK